MSREKADYRRVEEKIDAYRNLIGETLAPGEILIHEDEIKLRVDELAREIAKRYEGQSLLMVGLLKGSFVFMADLMRALHKAGLQDIEIDFMKASSYGVSTQSSGNVVIEQDMKADPAGRNVLLVDDIADTLHTFNGIAGHLQNRGLRSFATCAFLEKPSRHEIDFPLDFVGFKIPDVWVEGYGMDTGEHGRSYPHIVKGPTKGI